jgi:hypothetical protein
MTDSSERRYADHEPSASPPAPTPTAARTVDRIREAAREQLYWVLAREPDDRTWTLRQLDDTTGYVNAPAHRSGPLDAVAAIEWAGQLVDVESWCSLGDPDDQVLVDEIHALVRDLGWRPRRGRGIVVRREPDRHDPSVTLVRIYERWEATERISDPMYTIEAAQFGTDGELRAWVLEWVSRRYGLDQAGWHPGSAEGGFEYLHPGRT